MSVLPPGVLEIPLGEERSDEVLALDLWAFPHAQTVAMLRELPSPLTWERTLGMVRDDTGELVGMHSSYPFANCPVPGGRIAMSGLTWVAVHPQWRRQGLLHSMIAGHFRRSRARGESVSMLFAAEPAIYGRFGYGLASRDASVTLSRRAALRPVAGASDFQVRIEEVTPARHQDLIGDLHAQVRRPGWVTRETPQLAANRLAAVNLPDSGRESQRIVIVESEGVPVGYALFRRRLDWGATGADGKVLVDEVVAPTAAVAHQLWSRLLDFDLTTEISADMLALDDPLFSLLVDLRAARLAVKDNLWARILDLPEALVARQYQTDLNLVIEVSDELLAANAGRWRIRAEAFGPVSVQRSTDPADLALDIRELGAAYLGGTSLSELAGAGLVVEHTPGSLDRAAAGFGWPQAPVCSWIF